jgi:hypothetical protein
MAGFSLSLPLWAVSDDTEFLSGVGGWAVITVVIGGCARAFGTQAPIDDFGLVEDEAIEHVVVVGRGQAWRVTDRAIDVGDDATGSADNVVVVVANPGLVARNHAEWLNPSDQTDGGESVENVVHGLAGHVGQSSSNRRQDRLGVGVWIVVDSF